MNEFSDVRELLAKIRIAVGGCGLVGAAWDGDLLRVTHAMPETGKQVFVMTFDHPASDYEAATGILIEEFADESRAHFAPSSDQKENAA